MVTISDLDLKTTYIIIEIGKVNFSKRLGISYGKFLRMKKDYTKFTLSQINLIEELYKELYGNK